MTLVGDEISSGTSGRTAGSRAGTGSGGPNWSVRELLKRTAEDPEVTEEGTDQT